MDNDPLVWGYGSRMVFYELAALGILTWGAEGPQFANQCFNHPALWCLWDLFKSASCCIPTRLWPSSGRQAKVWVNPSGPVLGGLQGSGVLMLGENKGHPRAEPGIWLPQKQSLGGRRGGGAAGYRQSLLEAGVRTERVLRGICPKFMVGQLA